MWFLVVTFLHCAIRFCFFSLIIGVVVTVRGLVCQWMAQREFFSRFARYQKMATNKSTRKKEGWTGDAGGESQTSHDAAENIAEAQEPTKNVRADI